MGKKTIYNYQTNQYEEVDDDDLEYYGASQPPPEPIPSSTPKESEDEQNDEVPTD